VCGMEVVPESHLGDRRGNHNPSQTTSGKIHIAACKKITMAGASSSSKTSPDRGGLNFQTMQDRAQEVGRASAIFRSRSAINGIAGKPTPGQAEPRALPLA